MLMIYLSKEKFWIFVFRINNSIGNESKKLKTVPLLQIISAVKDHNY